MLLQMVVMEARALSLTHPHAARMLTYADGCCGRWWCWRRGARWAVVRGQRAGGRLEVEVVVEVVVEEEATWIPLKQVVIV